jgi:hypothetical protein
MTTSDMPEPIGSVSRLAALESAIGDALPVAIWILISHFTFSGMALQGGE